MGCQTCATKRVEKSGEEGTGVVGTHREEPSPLRLVGAEKHAIEFGSVEFGSDVGLYFFTLNWGLAALEDYTGVI